MPAGGSPGATAGPVDLIAANLPYVATGEWLELLPELRDHEPAQRWTVAQTDWMPSAVC